MGKRKTIISKGTEVLRAKIGHQEIIHQDDEGFIGDVEILPSKNQRLIPKKEYAFEGRLNPKGILFFIPQCLKKLLCQN